MLEPATAVLIAVTFLAAGCVKGIVGFGLPTVALALLAATVGIKPAIALTVFPSLLTNIWQAVAGGHLAPLLRRLWPFILAVFVGVYLGTRVLALASPEPLAILLGVLLCLYAATGLAQLAVPALGGHESWAGPIVGLVNGSVTGLTGTFIMPGVLYLGALGLGRAELIQAMGIMFMASTAALGILLVDVDLLSPETAAVSLAATAPAFAGMWLGRRIAARLDDAEFRRIFFIGLAILGVFLAGRSLQTMMHVPA